MNDYHFDHIELFRSFETAAGLFRHGDSDAALAYLNLLTTVLSIPAFMMVERWNDYVKGFGK